MADRSIPSYSLLIKVIDAETARPVSGENDKTNFEITTHNYGLIIRDSENKIAK